MTIQVFAPEGTGYVDAWIDDRPGFRLPKGDDYFAIYADLSELGPGEHELLLAADGSDTAFARRVFSRSHPLYVVVSTDWDDPDNTDTALALQEELHAEHAELLLTHFVGPYTFTAPEVSDARRAELAAWVIGMRDDHGDEIGLHIHPWCNFVDQVDEILGGEPVPCRTTPSTVYQAGDTSGYTIPVNAYTEEELTRQLLAADALFMENGLGKPTSFRAGGWTADLSTLRALAAAGHVADTSANNWRRMEEWEGVQNGVLYEWNSEHWATIDDTSQPYYPSTEDILVTGDEVVPVLEVPDNGIMVDYVSTTEMIDIFTANWDGSPLAAPVAYSIGYHPSNFIEMYQRRIDATLDHVDRFLASRNDGPVVYARLSDLTRVWPLPE